MNARRPGNPHGNPWGPPRRPGGPVDLIYRPLPRNPYGLAWWPDVLGHQAKVAREWGSVLNLPETVLPCELVLSGKRGSNGRVLVVRCRCMAGTVLVPSRRFVGYDPIGCAEGLDAAKAMWREHVAAKEAEARETA